MLYVPGSELAPANSTDQLGIRLVRTSELRPLERGEPIAVMYISERGGSIRRLIGMKHRHLIGVRFDPQMKYGQAVEGVVEGPAMMRCATDPDIPFYLTQPFRMVMTAGSALSSWTADLIYVTRDGQVWVREIKRSAADLADLGYVAKLQRARQLLSGLGWNVKPWTQKEILGSVERQHNIGIVYYDRAAEIDSLMPRFEVIAARNPVSTFGDLIRELDPRNHYRARAAVHRLIMRGRVWVDMDRLIEDWSEVHLRPEMPRNWDLPFS